MFHLVSIREVGLLQSDQHISCHGEWTAHSTLIKTNKKIYITERGLFASLSKSLLQEKKKKHLHLI